jgi:hypothetical protein
MRLTLSIALVLATAAPAFAAPRIAIPPGLQQSAVLCLGEALRLCPNALSAKDHGLSCILGKRRMLTAPCRTVYDQGLKFLGGQDVHLTLRPPKPH